MRPNDSRFGQCLVSVWYGGNEPRGCWGVKVKEEDGSLGKRSNGWNVGVPGALS